MLKKQLFVGTESFFKRSFYVVRDEKKEIRFKRFFILHHFSGTTMENPIIIFQQQGKDSLPINVNLLKGTPA